MGNEPKTTDLHSPEALAKRKESLEKRKAETQRSRERIKAEKESFKMTGFLAKREANHGIPMPGKAVKPAQAEAVVTNDQLQTAAVAKLMSQIVAAREDPVAFAEFVIRDPLGAPIVLKEFQKDWLRQMATAERLVIEASRGHGKCQPGWSRVLTGDGTCVPIEMLTQPTMIVAYNPETSTYEKRLALAQDNGIRNVLRFNISSGRTVDVTEEHPFYTWRGWVPANQLKPGDYVAVPAEIKNLGSVDLPDSIGWLTGLLIGDGSLQDPSPCITTGDSLIENEIHRVCELHNWSARPNQIRSGCKTFRLVGKTRSGGRNTARPTYLFGDLGLPRTHSRYKDVPKYIQQGTDYTIAEFIAGYLDSDGSVNLARGGSVSFGSVSNVLLRNVQSLLMRLGISSNLTKRTSSYKNEPYVSWTLSVQNAASLRIFASKIRSRGQRGQQLNELIRLLTLDTSDKADCLPKIWKEDLKEQVFYRYEKTGIRISNHYATSKEKALRAASFDNNQQLIDKINQPIRWYKIEEIQNIGEHKTYALEVEGLHNYITEDVITHNTTLVLAFCLWAIGKDPNIRIKLFCQNDKRARERLAEVKANIERNQTFHLVFPNCKPSATGEWSGTRIIVERPLDLKDATFEALGIETSATGGRCNLIVCDDVCDIRSSIRYPSMRDQIIQKFMGELIPILDPDGKILYIATPWSNSDLTAVLKANTEFKSLRYAIGNEQDAFAPLWPERWPRETLMKLRMQMGPIEFDRAYKCIAFSGDTVPCKPEWIKFYDASMLGNPQKLICIQAYDLAIAQSADADFFAGVTLLYDQERNFVFVVDAFHERVSFSTQAQHIIDNYTRWNADRVIIERVGLGGGLENYLRENSPIQIPLVGYKPKGKKEQRFTEATPWLEGGRIFFHPNLNPMTNLLVKERGDLIGEMLEFPIGRHDDLPDALVEALWGVEEFRVYDPEEGWTDGGGMRARMSVLG